MSEILKGYGYDENFEGSGQTISFTSYAEYLKKYIYANLSDGNSWKEIFYGGNGGVYSNDEIMNILDKTDADGNLINMYLAGGTPYTTEIYGCVKLKSTYVGALFGADVYDKYFFSRNDMVTSGGYYGTAQGLISQGAPDWIK